MSKKREIVETRPFSRQIASLVATNCLLQSDYDDLKKELAESPEKAPPLAGTGGVRKIRLKSASKGKSGGYRVCYFYYVSAEVIYLLFVFPKNEQQNLTIEQKRDLKSITDAIKRKK
jgi:mRNA-degrading endonuclease RelE of RelBE toxin-antitoxin system